MPHNYRYWIKIPSPYAIPEVKHLIMVPLNVPQFKIVEEREGENIFSRRKFVGPMVMINNDLQWLYNIERSNDRCMELKFIIQKWHPEHETYYDYWKGYFTCNDCDWNIDKNNVQFTPEPDDEYRQFIENGDKEVNILKAGLPYVGTSGVKGDTYEFKTCFRISRGPWGRRDPDCGLGAEWKILYIDQKATNVAGSSGFDQVWARYIIYWREVFYFDNVQDENGDQVEPPGEGWEQDTTYVSSEFIKWVRPVPDSSEPGGYTPDDDNPDVGFWATPRSVISFSNLSWVDCNTVGPGFRISECIPEGQYVASDIVSGGAVVDYPNAGKVLYWKPDPVPYDRNKKLNDVIRHLTNDISPGIVPASNEAMSNFFNSPINYVTGDSNKLSNLTIAQKSDILLSGSSEAATKGIWTFNKLMETLRVMFNAYWFIDKVTGKFRIEHISYWENLNPDIDITVRRYWRETELTNQYTYVKSNMPKLEKYSFMEAKNYDFVGAPIEYLGVCVNQNAKENVKTYSADNITTDLDFIYKESADSSAISTDGFVILANKLVGGQLEVINEVGLISGNIVSNGHLSWANLHYNYHRHNRSLLSGLMNKKPTTFLSATRTKKQIPIMIPLKFGDDQITWQTGVKSVIGIGKVNSSEFSLYTEIITLDLLHGVGDLSGYAVGRQFNNSFDNSFN